MEHSSDKHNERNGKIKIYYDGMCPMCRAVLKKVDKSSEREKFDPHDFTSSPLPHNISRADVAKEIHVVDAQGNIYKNSEAILKILDEYPRWKFLVAIGRFPGIRQLLPIGYKVVSLNRRFIFGPSSRIFWVKITLAVAFAAGFLLSIKLWVGMRFYPLLPVMGSLPVIPYSGYFLFFSLFVLLAIIIIVPKPRVPIFIFAALVFFFALFDQSRWQPWAYQYLFMFIALALFSWDAGDVKGRERALNICRLIMASMYFYSGLQKVNLNFMTSVFPWMAEPLIKILPEYFRIFPYGLGIGAPFIEMSIGVGLLTKKFRSSAIILAIAMHFFILAMIGPFGHNWNSVVWPWNTAMIILVLLLYWNIKDISTRDILWKDDLAFQKIVLVLFGIMPLMSFFNLWDSYPSFALYSGNTNSAAIYISDAAKSNLPPLIQQFILADKKYPYGNALDISAWSFGELNVPPYPETRIYKNDAKQICDYTHDSSEVMLAVYGRPAFAHGDVPTKYSCSDL